MDAFLSLEFLFALFCIFVLCGMMLRSLIELQASPELEKAAHIACENCGAPHEACNEACNYCGSFQLTNKD